MPDIRKRDYGRELAKRKDRRARKRRAAPRQLTAKCKRELAERKRQRESANSEAAEQAGQAAELTVQESAELAAHGGRAMHRTKELERKNDFSSEVDPSIHPSDPRGAAAQAAPARERSNLTGTAPSAKKPPARSVRTATAAGSSKASAAAERGRRLAMQRGKQRTAISSPVKRSAGGMLERLRHGAVQMVKGARALPALTLAWGGVIAALPLFGIIFLAAAVFSSPFGILFANEPSKGAIPLNAAVAQVNMELTDTLTELQAGDYDSIDLTGEFPDWREVTAVFAAKTAGAEDGVDVATMDADRVARLKAVFWDMCAVTSEVETISHDGGADGEGWTERILHITVTAKTAEEMREAYRFTDYQNQALTELLDDPSLLNALLSDLGGLQYGAGLLRRALPKDLSGERRAVVEWALSLVGKVNYSWGGKSLVFGWDDRWGQLAKVTAAGSSTTGTYRAYGLDCSGMVDWVFYNATNGGYVIGHGGGAAMQHSYCTDISWADAQPGDLVFYPGDEHVGIVGGWDKDGNTQIIHCAGSYNNVVITGKEGFTAVGRPQYYGE